ncbi:HD domain-containing phosphohydrolase [Deinococcus aquiradiocola]|uniref:Diguanylate cyclase n=1 Tax=Deinococcus aquiradiocola TaxID=393059 RepID=A0A917P9I4_9DEIO|nr:HD domain-containing phosphohydrolase [Deinococcus aquiradiocola]GGJ67740.1 diguanylate cyclase [Deinococcus aquiradiocola]
MSDLPTTPPSGSDSADPVAARALAQLRALEQSLLDLLNAPQPSSETLGLAQEFVQRARESSDPAVEGGAQELLARAHLQVDAYREAAAALREATRLHGVSGDAHRQADAHVLAGKMHLNLGQYDEAETHLQAALRLLDGADLPALHATALNHLAGVQYGRGDASGALLTLGDALKLWTAHGDARGRTHCLTNIGTLQHALGQYHAGIVSLTEAYGTAQRDLHDPEAEMFILNSLGDLHAAMRDHGLAMEVTRGALEIAQRLGHRLMIATGHLNLGTFALEAGLDAEAEAYLETALARNREIGNGTGELATLDSLGRVYARTGRHAQATEAFAAALSLAGTLEDLPGELETRLHLAEAHVAANEPDHALPHLERALSLARSSGNPRMEADAFRLLSDAAEQKGEYRAALQHTREHLRLKDSLFHVERDRQTRNLSIQFEVERARHDADVYRVRTEVEQDARIVAEQLVLERTAELARAQQEVVTRLAVAAEYRDDTTGEHTRRVGRAAARIARALGWTEERARLLGIAARLHDVGKIGIPDSVLLKPGRLTPDEFRLMQGHTRIGARILSGGRSELLRLAEEVAMTHHERWDGRGYPQGLSGEDIPISGRIVALADVYDALTQARPYKAAWTAKDALTELRRASGTQFDPLIVPTALRVLEGLHEQALDDAEHDGDVMDREDTTRILGVFDQLLLERTRDLEAARQEAERRGSALARLEVTDALTDLPNRQAFESDLEAAFLTHREAGLTAGPGEVHLLTFDLDDLKGVNDRLGREVGDRVLRAFALALQDAPDDLGRAYRLGGDVFAMIVHAPVTPAQADALRERLLTSARQADLPSFGVSVGAASAPGDAATPGELRRASERRMLADKRRRRQP